ncbi:MAG TPA: MT-A70 family methyltransferase [Sedimentisphaerales bacterium]|nr:MT-A70 family methyltransferase [Sedimentisphaerales bacterium]
MNQEFALVHFDRARAELAKAVRVDEVKRIRDKAEAVRAYIRQQQGSVEMQNQAAEIKVRAERRVGELLAETISPGNPQLSDGTTIGPSLSELGISRDQSSAWQKVASLPEKDFERHLTEAREKKRPITTVGVLRAVNEAQGKAKQPLLPKGKYRVIYADPPWQYGDKLVKGYGPAANHYPTMSIAELCALPIKALAADDAVLFLWVTSPLLDNCFGVIHAWGFEYKASFVWDKVRHNFGHYNSVRHEFLLLCTRGSCLPENKRLVDSVQVVERTPKHSEKPEAFREMIDLLYPSGPRIELFARKEVAGWTAYGNERIKTGA